MIRKLLLPLLLVLSLCGCAKQPLSFGYAMGEASCVVPSGEVSSMSAPAITEGGVGYLPKDSFLAFSEELPEGTEINGTEYLPITATAETLGLALSRRGSVFCIAETPEALMDHERVALALEYEFSPLREDELQLDPAICVDPYVIYTYEQMMLDIEELVSHYPGLVEAESFGKSAEGRELMKLRLGRGERQVLLNASIHGCEHFSTSFAMFLIDRYAYAYATGEEFGGKDCKELLDNVSFVFSVMLNPDGVNIAQNGIKASSNYENICRMSMKDTGWWGWKTNSNGVDLNRNFPFNWWQSNYDYTPGARYYHGPEEASESETRAMMELLRSTPYLVFIDLHLFGEQVDWIDSETLHKAEQYRPLADNLMTAFGYDDWGVENVSSFGGYLVNYARNTYDAPAMLLELTRFWRCPQNRFDTETEKLWCLLHLLGDYTMGEEQPGISVAFNGELLSLPGCRERAISEEQLRELLAELGAELSVGDAVSVSCGTEELVFEIINSENLASEGLLARLSDGGYADILPILWALGADASLDTAGETLMVEQFR